MRNFFMMCIVSLVAFLATGCSRYDIVDCSSEEQEYIDASLLWMEQHSSVIEDSMTAVRPIHQANLADILQALGDTPIVCGEGHRDDVVAGTTRYVPTEEIVIDFTHPQVLESLDLYRQSAYVADYTAAELADPTVIDYNVHHPLNDLLGYNDSLAELGLILSHEGAHVLLGAHSHQVDQVVKELEQSGSSLEPEVTKDLDEVFGWGYATLSSALTVYGPERDAIVTASGF